MPVTSQYDLLLNAWQAHHVNRGYWNLYAHLSQVQNFAVPGHPPAPYPFGFYLSLAGWLWIVQALGLIDYTAWRTPLVLLEYPATILALKLPYLAAHVAVGLLLFKAAPTGWRWLAWAIWAWSLSPAYLLLMGQNDLPMTLLMVAAAALAARALQMQQVGHPRWRWIGLGSVVLLGLGATYKTAPLMLVPPFALLLSARWRERLMFIGIPTAVFAIAAMPFLTTPAFVNGALLNPEGARLFSNAQLFAQPASLFLVAYVALTLILAMRPHQAARPVDFWIVGAAIFAALFLFAWTQFYWLVWLTPFVVGLIAQDAPRRMLWFSAWLIGEIAFGALLFGMHRDLGWGLLGLGSSQFRFAQFEVVMDLSPLGLRQPFEALWSLLRSAQVAAWLMLLVAAVSGVSKTFAFVPLRRSFAQVMLGVPLLACACMAGVTLFLSRNAVVQEFGRQPVKDVRLSARQPAFTQVLSPTLPMANGLLLWSTAPPTLSLEACAHTEADVFCAQGRPMKNAYFSGYAFWFGLPSGRASHALSFRLVEPSNEASLVIQLGRHHPRFGEQHRVIQDGMHAEGIIRMALLYPFDLVQAGREMVTWLVRDWRVPLMGMSLMAGTALLLARAARLARFHRRRSHAHFGLSSAAPTNDDPHS
ncbi:MAG: glycosyltransferase 87 family protein [Anaerolineae bacterium]|nr:glycosyltransferase 87 family protein [Anaerolineae bacterium]